MQEIEKLIKEFRNWQLSGVVTQIFNFLLISVVILVIAWLIRKTINNSIHDNMLRYRARKITRFTSFFLILILAVATFTGKMQFFGISIGIFTAGVAFALQEVILSLAGWISIVSSHIYKPGDRIEIDSIRGDVINIGLTRTTLMEIGEWISNDNYSGRIVQISNSFVFKGPVKNYSTDFPFVWDEINLPVKYGSDMKLAKDIMLNAANELVGEYTDKSKEKWKEMVKIYLIEDAVVSPTVTVGLTDNWIHFNLRYIVDYKLRRSTKDKIFTLIDQKIKETNGKVTMASATFEITSIPELKVDLETKKT